MTVQLRVDPKYHYIPQDIIEGNHGQGACGGVLDAYWLSDNSIISYCQTEDFRVINANGNKMAISCSAAENMGIAGACP